jgi:xanthine dehydrogenase FAD-binding subunit
VLEGLRSPTVFFPKTINEAVAFKLKYPNAVFWAGGTYLMSRPNFYPSTAQKDIISLKGLPDLTKIYHADRFIEAGSMVTIQQLINVVGYSFSKELDAAMLSIGSSLVRNQATIGGALCSKDMRFSLCCILATLNAQAEIKMVSKKAQTRWVPISKLYDRKGTFIYADDALLTKVRIPSDSKQNKIFRTIGSPVHRPQEAVIFGLQYSTNQANITLPNMCIVFPSSCFYMSQVFDNLISTINLPLSADRIKKLSKSLSAELKTAALNATPIQIERASRLFEVVLNDINTAYLEG